MTNKERQESIRNTNDLVSLMAENYRRAYANFKRQMSIVHAKMRLSEDEKAVFAELYALTYRTDELATLYNLKGKSDTQLLNTKGNTIALQEINCFYN